MKVVKQSAEDAWMARDVTVSSDAAEFARVSAEPMAVSTNPHDVVQAALALAERDELHELEELDRRWVERRLQVLVAGEAKRGKSSLINALLGQSVLPTGITPLTSVTTTVSSVSETHSESITVNFAGGRCTEAPLRELASFVTEAKNPSNVLDVRGVTAWVHSPLLSTYRADLVDTPGIGSVYSHNTAEAHRALRKLDAAVLVLSVDPPISAAEQDLLHAILDNSVRTFIIINKCDRYTAHEVREALAFTKAVCIEVAGTDLNPRPCSVVRGKDDPGFANFRQDLLAYLAGHGHDDVRIALGRHTTRILTAMRDRRLMEHRAIEMAARGEAEKVVALRERLAVISGQRSEIKDRVTGSQRRLRGDLDAAAAAAVASLAGECRSAFEQHWSQRLVHAPLREMHALAHAMIVDHLTAAVDAWRMQQTTRLEEELTLVVNRAHAETEAQIALARLAVSEALDIRWIPDETHVALPMDTNFHYDFSPALSWAPPLAGTFSPLRTPAARRRHIKKSASDSITSLTDRQVGRARSDLQSRLHVARRAVVDNLEERLDATVERMVQVLERATVADSGSQDPRARLREIATAEHTLTTLLEETQRV